MLDEWEVHGQSTLHTLERRLQDILKGIEGHEVPDDDTETENENESRNENGCTGRNIPAKTFRRQSPSSSSSSSTPSPSSSFGHNLIRAASGRKSSRLVDASASTSPKSDTTSAKNYKETNRNKQIPDSATVPAAISLPSMRYLADDFTEIPFDSVPHYRC